MLSTALGKSSAASNGSSKRFIFKYFLSKAGVIKLPAFFKKNISENLARISKFSLKNRSFINIFKIWSLTDACYGLRSYERGVAQLGSAGALGALGRRFESCRPDSIKTKSY